MRPHGLVTVSALSCSFRTHITPPPAVCPSYSFSLPHCHTNSVLSNLHSWTHSQSKLRGTLVLGDRLLFSPKGTRWIPPRAKWKHNTEPQTTNVKRSFSGTVYWSLLLKVTTVCFFPVFMFVLCIQYCGCNSVTAGLLWLYLCWRLLLYYVGQRLLAVLQWEQLLPLFGVTPQAILWSLPLKAKK